MTASETKLRKKYPLSFKKSKHVIDTLNTDRLKNSSLPEWSYRGIPATESIEFYGVYRIGDFIGKIVYFENVVIVEEIETWLLVDLLRKRSTPNPNYK